MYAQRTMQQGAHEKTPVVAGVCVGGWRLLFPQAIAVNREVVPTGVQAVREQLDQSQRTVLTGLARDYGKTSVGRLLYARSTRCVATNRRGVDQVHGFIALCRGHCFGLSWLLCLSLAFVARMYRYYRQFVERSTIFRKYFGKLSKIIPESNRRSGFGSAGHRRKYSVAT